MSICSLTRTDSDTYGRINVLALELRNIDFEASGGIFGQTDFIRRRTAGNVHSVALTHHGDNSSRISPNPVAVVCTARDIDIKASENFCRALIQAEDDLNGAIGILRMNRYCRKCS